MKDGKGPNCSRRRRRRRRQEEQKSGEGTSRRRRRRREGKGREGRSSRRRQGKGGEGNYCCSRRRRRRPGCRWHVKRRRLGTALWTRPRKPHRPVTTSFFYQGFQGGRMPPRTTLVPPLYTCSLRISGVRCPAHKLTSHNKATHDAPAASGSNAYPRVGCF